MFLCDKSTMLVDKLFTLFFFWLHKKGSCCILNTHHVSNILLHAHLAAWVFNSVSRSLLEGTDYCK